MIEEDLTVLTFPAADNSVSHMHEPFLERASGDGDTRGQALGAFLTLPLIDRVATEPGALKSEAMAYQLRACASYLDEQHPDSEEITHLREIVRVARTASESGNKRLLWAPMLAFAYWLEQELRLEESLDV